MDAFTIFCDTILPGDHELGLPSAAELEMDLSFDELNMQQDVSDYLTLLDMLASDVFGPEFAKLNADQRLEIVEKSKRKNIRLATAIIVQCLKVYYTSPLVLKNLPAGAVPPFPTGNQLDDDDWSLLDSVYERGPVYRPVT